MSERIAAEILRQVAARGVDKSICPSEVARALAPGHVPDDWRGLLTGVRRAARELARAGRIEILRKGHAVDPGAEIKGVIRLRLRGDQGGETS